MKKVIISSIMLLMIMVTATRSNAQVSVNVNIDLQPDWGPIGYDYVEYYFLPECEIYYFVPKRQFVYFDAGKWIFVSALPPRCRTLNLYSSYKVVINEPKAYVHFDDHKVKYVKYKGGGEKQVIIRDSDDPKYKNARNQKAPPQKKGDKEKQEKKNDRPDDERPNEDKPK